MASLVHPDRFRAKYIARVTKNCTKVDVDSCYIWNLARNKDYGHMSYSYYLLEDGVETYYKRWAPPHRVIFACTFDCLFLLNPDFKHLEISHLCHTKLCCNPQHLELETGKENKKRSKCSQLANCDPQKHPTLEPCMHS